MRKVLLFLPTLAWAALLAALSLAQASESLDRCHTVAEQCRSNGGSDSLCQQQVDACMSDNACEEVYMSCLELMEADEEMTEAACGQKRMECRRRHGQG